MQMNVFSHVVKYLYVCHSNKQQTIVGSANNATGTQFSHQRGDSSQQDEYKARVSAERGFIPFLQSDGLLEEWGKITEDKHLTVLCMRVYTIRHNTSATTKI